MEKVEKIERLDVRGLNCPEPILRLKNALDSGASALEVVCDCGSAEENIARFAANAGFKLQKTKNEGAVSYKLEK